MDPTLKPPESMAAAYQRKKNSIYNGRAKNRREVLRELSLLFYRTRHRFDVVEFEMIKKQFELVNIEI